MPKSIPDYSGHLRPACPQVQLSYYQIHTIKGMDRKEYITHSAGDKDAWTCVCGNRPTSDGFYSCDKEGNEVVPTREAWKTNWYVCARCGRMIDADTLEVVGRNENAKFLA